MLQFQEFWLRRVDALPVAHDLPAITMHRGTDDRGEYADLLADTRASISRLREGPAGQYLLNGLQRRAQEMQPGVPAAARQPIVRISSAHGDGSSAAPDAQTLDAVRHAYRYDDQRGTGTASSVRYDESDPRATRFIDLGHELVHAWRNAHGMSVSPLEVSHRNQDAVLADPDVHAVLSQRSDMREEFETVGLTPTPAGIRRGRIVPTENMLRREHELPDRQRYSGLTPGFDNQDVADADRATDTEVPRQALSPVQRILRHLGA